MEATLVHTQIQTQMADSGSKLLENDLRDFDSRYMKKLLIAEGPVWLNYSWSKMIFLSSEERASVNWPKLDE